MHKLQHLDGERNSGGDNTMVKLFGFTLNQTSGVLIFMTGLLFLATGAVMMYTAFSTWSLTGAIPPASMIIAMTVTLFGAILVGAAVKAR